MLTLKFSPLLLFIILLLVLVFSTILCKNCLSNMNSKSKKEGFVSFNADIDPTANSNVILELNIPQYSEKKNVSKLYDTLFFDTINGNMIEVNSSHYVGGNVSGNVDTNGSSITNIYVNTRNNTNHSYATSLKDGNVVPKNTTESLLDKMENSFTSWSYVTSSENTDRYQLFYMPWADSTYIHVLKLRDYGSTNNSPSHLMSYMFGSANTMVNKNHNSQRISITSKNDDNDANNGKYVYDTYYDPIKTVYQLSKNVKFDKSNGNLIIRSTSSITVYDRYGNNNTYSEAGKISGTTNKIQNVEYNSFVYSDNDKYVVLYMPISTKTLIALLKVDPADSTRYKIERVVRFNSNGVDNSTNAVDDKGNASDSISDYYKWYWYWQSNGSNYDEGKFSDNYMLKTQIVPPVCPSCPSCSSNTGTCTNCGGSGGSGTLTNNGSSVVSNTGSRNVINNTVDQTGNVISGTVNTAGDIVNKTIDTTGGLLTSAGSGATNLVKSGTSGAVDLVKSGTSGAVDLVKSGTSGAVDLVKSGVGGAVDLVKSAGSGLKEIAMDNNGRPIYNNVGTGAGGAGGAVGTVGVGGASGIDNYSYYGALPSKGANYIPITADFSAFSK